MDTVLVHIARDDPPGAVRRPILKTALGRKTDLGQLGFEHPECAVARLAQAGDRRASATVATLQGDPGR